MAWIDDLLEEDKQKKEEKPQQNIDLPKDHLSVSAINTYLTCPARFMFRYEMGLKIPPKAAMTFGKCTHEAIEYNYNHKMDTGKDLPVSEVQEYFAYKMEEAKDETEWDEDPNQLKDEGVQIVEVYHNNVAQNIFPVAVEEKVEIPVAGVNFLGFVDLIDQNGIIRDTKTAKRKPNQKDIDKNIQVTAYSMAYRQLFGKQEGGIAFDYLIRNKKPKVEEIKTARTEQDHKRFEKIVGSVIQAISNKIYYPNMNHFSCSPDFCGYWHECHKMF